MKINYIKTIGFRKFEQKFETSLYDVTAITGGNTKGKTNILYAIIWAFLGTNLTGDDKVWLGNNNSDDCYVELKFTDNLCNKHTLVRYKNKYDNKKNFVTLDNKKAEPEDLISFYGDKKLFLSILNPNYFIGKKPSEQKELLDKYLPELDISIAYDKLEDSEKMYLEGVPQNIVDYLKDLNSSKKMYEDKIKNLRGKIEYAETIANTAIEEKKVFKKSEELSLARQELSFLSSNQSSIDKKQQERIVSSLENQISQIEQQITNLSLKMKTGKKTYLSMKNESISYCPMCNQKVENDSKLIATQNLKSELEQYFEEKTKLEERLLDLKSKITIEKLKLYSLTEFSNTDKAKQISIVQNQIHVLEQEQLEVEKFNNTLLLKQNNINQSKQDLKIFENQIKEYTTLIDNIRQTKEIAQKLYINYIEEKMKFATKHLKNVKIKYYTILKDSGEIKEDFIITYNNNELKNLSRSEIIATSLELCNMFNKMTSINLPLFIDDSESCADYNFTQEYSKDTQILIAKVEKGQDLTIQNALIKENDYLQAA